MLAAAAATTNYYWNIYVCMYVDMCVYIYSRLRRLSRLKALVYFKICLL